MKALLGFTEPVLAQLRSEAVKLGVDVSTLVRNACMIRINLGVRYGRPMHPWMRTETRPRDWGFISELNSWQRAFFYDDSKIVKTLVTFPEDLHEQCKREAAFFEESLSAWVRSTCEFSVYLQPGEVSPRHYVNTAHALGFSQEEARDLLKGYIESFKEKWEALPGSFKTTPQLPARHHRSWASREQVRCIGALKASPYAASVPTPEREPQDDGRCCGSCFSPGFCPRCNIRRDIMCDPWLCRGCGELSEMFINTGDKRPRWTSLYALEHANPLVVIPEKTDEMQPPQAKLPRRELFTEAEGLYLIDITSVSIAKRIHKAFESANDYLARRLRERSTRYEEPWQIPTMNTESSIGEPFRVYEKELKPKLELSDPYHQDRLAGEKWAALPLEMKEQAIRDLGLMDLPEYAIVGDHSELIVKLRIAYGMKCKNLEASMKKLGIE